MPRDTLREQLTDLSPSFHAEVLDRTVPFLRKLSLELCVSFLTVSC